MQEGGAQPALGAGRGSSGRVARVTMAQGRTAPGSHAVKAGMVGFPVRLDVGAEPPKPSLTTWRAGTSGPGCRLGGGSWGL